MRSAIRRIPRVSLILANGKDISIRVQVPGTSARKFRNLGVRIEPNQWDSEREMVKKNHPDYRDLNAQIWEQRDDLVKQFEKDLSQHTEFTEELIYARLIGVEAPDVMSFYDFAQKQMDLLPIKGSTKTSMESRMRKMQEFAPNVTFDQITYAWLQKYENWLRTSKANDNNTVWNALRFVRRIMGLALKMKYTKNYPFKEYEMPKYIQGIPAYLEWKEIQEFHSAVKTKPMTDRLRLVGYYCLLSCYTGLRYEDAVKFDYNTRIRHTDTGKRMILETAKTGEIVSIAFNKYITEVTAYIKDKPIKTTNQEYNADVKSLCSIAGITKDISSHSFRHSFAMRCAELGMSIDEVQKLLGHNKRTSTEIYFRIRDGRLDDAMKKWD